MIDYVGVGDQFDRVQLGRSPDQLEYYGFRSDKDSLFLYSIDCALYDTASKFCDSGALGRRLYTLVRKKE